MSPEGNNYSGEVGSRSRQRNLPVFDHDQISAVDTGFEGMIARSYAFEATRLASGAPVSRHDYYRATTQKSIQEATQARTVPTDDIVIPYESDGPAPIPEVTRLPKIPTELLHQEPLYAYSSDD